MPPRQAIRGIKRKKRREIVTRKFGVNIRIKTSSGWHKGGVRVGYWASIAPGYLYLAYKTGRSYWLFRNGAKAKMATNDEKQIIKVNSFQIQFMRPVDYEYAKKCLKLR